MSVYFQLKKGSEIHIRHHCKCMVLKGFFKLISICYNFSKSEFHTTDVSPPEDTENKDTDTGL
jgi:hypothetical protein